MPTPKKHTSSQAGDNQKLPSDRWDLELWQTNRRTFLKAALIAGAVSQLGFLAACGADDEMGNEYFTAEQIKTFKQLLLKLFPDDGNGPSAEDLHSYEYILWLLKDPGEDEKDKAYIRNGVNRIDETSNQHFHANFIALDTAQQDELIVKYMETEYGHQHCSMLITFIFESLLLDPVYGGNPGGIGWKWLNHTPGYPPATEELRYENILKTVRAAY